MIVGVVGNGDHDPGGLVDGLAPTSHIATQSRV